MVPHVNFNEIETNKLPESFDFKIIENEFVLKGLSKLSAWKATGLDRL